MAFTDALVRTLVDQHQVMTWGQLLDGAGSRRRAERLIDLGVFERIQLNVWRAAGSPVTFEQQAMAAVLAAGDGAMAARRTAAWLSGLVEGRPPARLQVVVAHDRRPAPTLPGVTVHRSRTLRPDHRQTVRGVPTTSPARTVTDLAITLGVPDLRDLVARGLRTELLTLPAVSDELERAGRIRGARRLGVALSQLDADAGAAQSRAEQTLYDALVAAGITGVVRQYPVDLPSGRVYLDLALVEPRIAIEVDGFWWHSTPAQKADDERRQNDLVALQWRPLRFGAGLVATRPHVAVATVRAALLPR